MPDLVEQGENRNDEAEQKIEVLSSIKVLSSIENEADCFTLILEKTKEINDIVNDFDSDNCETTGVGDDERDNNYDKMTDELNHQRDTGGVTMTSLYSDALLYLDVNTTNGMVSEITNDMIIISETRVREQEQSETSRIKNVNGGSTRIENVNEKVSSTAVGCTLLSDCKNYLERRSVLGNECDSRVESLSIKEEWRATTKRGIATTERGIESLLSQACVTGMQYERVSD